MHPSFKELLANAQSCEYTQSLSIPSSEKQREKKIPRVREILGEREKDAKIKTKRVCERDR